MKKIIFYKRGEEVYWIQPYLGHKDLLVEFEVISDKENYIIKKRDFDKFKIVNVEE